MRNHRGASATANESVGVNRKSSHRACAAVPAAGCCIRLGFRTGHGSVFARGMSLIQYRFKFTDEFLLTASLRYRRQLWWRRPFHALKGTLAIVILGLGVLCAAFGSRWTLVAFAAFAGALTLGWPIDAWVIRRRFRKSPYRNDDIVFSLSEDGAHITGRDSEVRMGWSSFTKVRRFKDGVLLFQGPQFFNWLPDSAAVAPDGPEEAVRVARAHVRDYRDV